MTSQINYLLYQTFGISGVMHEACYSIASLSKFINEKSGVQVFICTDNEKFLSALLPEWIQYVSLTAEQLKAWRGNQDYLHRIKPEMLRFFSSNHPGNILYCDTDTVFLNSPLPLFEEIESGRVVMHRSEGHIHNQGDHPLFIKTSKFLRSYSFPNENVAYDMEMWNAGIMGFNSARRSLFDQILPLLDDLYSKYKRHYMEQVAVSHFFGKLSPLACDDYVFHYWNFKEFRTVLQKFFDEHYGEPFEVWVKDIEKISPVKLIQPKLEFEKLPKWKQELRKIIGQSWDKELLR